MKINRINSSAPLYAFNARFRADQNKKRALPLLQPMQYGTLSTDKLLSTQDFLNLRGNDGIASASKTYDSFTGLRDKNYLIAVLNKAISDSKTQKKGLSMAMFDMDNFKSINELLGYEAGDNFIRIMSDGISSAADSQDVSAYRYGGDEFILIFNNHSPKAKDNLVQDILLKFRSNSYINAMAKEYKANAEQKLSDCVGSSFKIQEIMKLKAQRSILQDLIQNFSPEAQSEPYLVQKLSKTNNDLRILYLDLISDAMSQEKDEKTKRKLMGHYRSFMFEKPISDTNQELLDEYLMSVYDKSAEIYKLKQWLQDYKTNDGFSFTASVVDFTPQMLADKKPLGIINEIGESLKQGKSLAKGQNYLY